MDPQPSGDLERGMDVQKSGSSAMSRDFGTWSTRRSRTESESLEKALTLHDSDVFSTGEAHFQGLGFAAYLSLSLLISAGFAGAAVALWSSMGCGESCLEFLQTHQKYALHFLIFLACLLIVLYMFDFFLPAHLPGRVFSTGHRDWLVRPVACLCVLGATLAACFLAYSEHPAVPLVLTTFMCPLCILLLRRFTAPGVRFQRESSAGKDVADSCFEARMEMLKLVTWEEKDHWAFYVAATIAFGITGVGTFVVWVIWASGRQKNFGVDVEDSVNEEPQEREKLFIMWAAPLIVAVSNFAFASFAGLRVLMDRAYAATDEVKNRLLIGSERYNMNEELLDHRLAMLKSQLQATTSTEGGGAELDEKRVLATRDNVQKYLVQHIEHMRQLSSIVKATGCAFIALIGCLYIGFQLTVADSSIAVMIQGFVAALFVTYLIFVCVAFNRLWLTMRNWLQDLPMWKSAVALTEANPARALGLCAVLPLIPPVLVMSGANQAVRRMRGIDSGGTRWRTARVQAMVDDLWKWDWVRVGFSAYMVGTCVILYKVIPIFLNVLLAWMSATMASFSFELILVSTFAVGMFLFMLPPVPGPPIYLFGGFVISDKCPFGFWWGAVITVVLSFVLKLAACAVQQSIIGGYLGGSLTVQRAVGVHKPFIRAIEAVLRKPGLSFGKCMILCGGPDWPTSVLAGILKLSLRQCLMGTFPVIASVIPLCLTGSFYLKRAESDVWLRAGNLMFSLTALVSVGFWAGMSWAIQEEFDKNSAKLMAPKPENVELEWLDYRDRQIAAKSVVKWEDMPRLIRVLYFSGGLLLTLAAHALFWRAKQCFGVFTVVDDIETLQWLGPEGLIRPMGAIGLCVAAFSLIGLFAQRVWKRGHGQKDLQDAVRELAAEEATWKADWLDMARNSTNPPTPQAREAAEAALRSLSEQVLAEASNTTTEQKSTSLQPVYEEPELGIELELPSPSSFQEERQERLAKPELHPVVVGNPSVEKAAEKAEPVQAKQNFQSIVVMSSETTTPRKRSSTSSWTGSCLPQLPMLRVRSLP
eukprot:TRINITY_DN6396_c0_g1_i2.p1 TRINITY_DN6396_c0_g1~~TRINITY_DN6396_c0_g1_i2.p1  ORF type:complete len:1041 (-),score=203.70 TRINITY_DN6396_c0_g1_i2:503-3625(-)